jgi:hypothetical protein
MYEKLQQLSTKLTTSTIYQSIPTVDPNEPAQKICQTFSRPSHQHIIINTTVATTFLQETKLESDSSPRFSLNVTIYIMHVQYY